MMNLICFIDAAPDPVSIGVLAAVILTVIGFVLLLAAGLVIFLWYRKRSLRHVDISSPQFNRNDPE